MNGLHEKQIKQEFIHVASPEENSFIEAYHSIVEKEVLEPRQFEKLQTAIDTFNRWKIFYNKRRVHGRIGKITSKQQWNKWLIQINKEPVLIISTTALSTNGERKSFKIEVSRLVDKIFINQKLDIFEYHSH